MWKKYLISDLAALTILANTSGVTHAAEIVEPAYNAYGLVERFYTELLNREGEKRKRRGSILVRTA